MLRLIHPQQSLSDGRLFLTKWQKQALIHRSSSQERGVAKSEEMQGSLPWSTWRSLSPPLTPSLSRNSGVNESAAVALTKPNENEGVRFHVRPPFVVKFHCPEKEF